jgi:hypothetical protein
MGLVKGEGPSRAIYRWETRGVVGCAFDRTHEIDEGRAEYGHACGEWDAQGACFGMPGWPFYYYHS